MKRRWISWGALVCAVPVVVLACADDKAASGKNTPDAAPDAPSATANPTGTSSPFPDGGPARRTGCLDKPGAPARPDRLPCELIPPGLTL